MQIIFNSTRYQRFLKFLPLIFLLSCTTSVDQTNKLIFDHYYIANPLPGKDWGTGAFTLADFDKDGDLDITIDRRTTGTVYWYEFKNQSVWTQHIIGPSDGKQLGAKTADLNEDGYEDLIMARIWFKNPGNLKENPDQKWKRYKYNGGMNTENHDVGVADIDGDGHLDVVCYSQNTNNGTLRWYTTTDGADWTPHNISTTVNETVKDRDPKGVHAGFAPNGIGDLDGDDAPDIVMPAGWYKNPKKTGSQWKLIPWNFTIGTYPNAYGTSIRSWIIDIDKDGDNDIVYSNSDNANSKVYIIENNGGKFERHALPSAGSQTGSFHSLVVNDFNNDGKVDVFVGEQEDSDKYMKPKSGFKERGLLYMNTSKVSKMDFTLYVIQKGNPGWHDTRGGDVDGDGDIDLVTKVWNKDGAHYTASFWENNFIGQQSTEAGTKTTK